MGHIYHYPGEVDKATYDLENVIADPDAQLEQFMESLLSFEGAALADIGAGGGYHVCRYAQKAARVFAIEPAPLMLRQLYARVSESGLSNISVLSAGAEEIPLKKNTVEIIHSRFAYFFGAEQGSVRSCEPGIRESLRILKPAGYFFIIDNALMSGQFASLLSRYGYSKGVVAEMERNNDSFYESWGFTHTVIPSVWRAPERKALEAVLKMEFSGQDVSAIMSELEGSEISYHYKVYYRQK